MTKFRGKIGINRGPIETSPGIFTPTIEEVEVTGEIRSIGARWRNASLRETVSARHVLSIVTPESSVAEYTEVVYIWWQTQKWAVVEIEYKRPRVELTLGGVYNG